MKEDKILLSHGSGGKLSYKLIKELFLANFNNNYLKKLDDGAILNIDGLNLAILLILIPWTLCFLKEGILES